MAQHFDLIVLVDPGHKSTPAAEADPGLLRGTLDLFVLKTLSRGPMHGLAVVHWIERTTGQRRWPTVRRNIGLEETDDGVWAIYFNTVLLATLDERDYIIRG